MKSKGLKTTLLKLGLSLNLLLILISASAQSLQHPSIWITADERFQVLEKIEKYDWARSIVAQLHDHKASFQIEKGTIATNRKFVLDLGQVNIAARVILNGQDLGVAWMSPHKIDLTTALKEGENQLRIEVTNQWTNRLIGDENYPNKAGFTRTMENMPEWYTNNEPAPLQERSTFTAFPFYKKGDPLLPAGLIGPVQITTTQVVRLTK